jgi:hypothetical protein
VISLPAKLLATVLLVPTVLLATVAGERPLWVRAIMLGIAAGVMLFIWTKKSR